VFYVKQTYKSCKTENDKFCGLLHCHIDGAESADDVYKMNLGIVHTEMLRYLLVREGKKCAMTSFDLGENNCIF